jgi:carboxypeptidase T
MKKLILLFCCLLNLSLISQNELYYRVKINGTSKDIATLASIGVTVDHGEQGSNSLITEISESELTLLKGSNISYDLLISDMASYYENRNKNETKGQAPSAGPCNTPNIITPLRFHLGSMGGFFTLNEMIAIIDSMRLLYPNLISIKQSISSTNSIQGRPIYYVKISDNPDTDEPEPEVMYNSLHHAREAASLSQLIYYMWYLLENYNTNTQIKAIVDNTEMYFVPCVNPDGYVHNQTTNPNGGGMWRKNRRVNSGGTFGVDLNRNYGYQWAYDNTGSSPNSSSDTYRGTSAFSEPETQAMRDFCIARNFKFALNNHTYSNLLIYPWGYLPSFYTPDSAIFVNWAKLLTKDDQFLYGTGDQTVNYVTNGDSDDWMYGEQMAKPKMLIMTPEAGSSTDGFWPAQNRIIDICKTTFSQNVNAAWLVTKFAVTNDLNDKFIFQPNGFIKYNIQRLGLENGSFTVAINPVGAGIASVGAPKVYPLAILQSATDSISYTLAGGLTSGVNVKYAIEINNGFYTHKDTITRKYGVPVTVFSDNCNTLSQWTAVGWGVSTNQFVSATGSITDSPAGLYGSNQTKNATVTSTLNLTNAVYAHLQYYTKYELEKSYDYVQVQISTNGGTSWTALCGKYTSLGTNGTTLNQPLYDGKRDEFALEDIDLTAYIGQTVKLRYYFKSDAGTNLDGFYADDVLLRKLVASTTGIADIETENVFIYPNPSSTQITVQSATLFENYAIVNQMGQIVKQDKINNSIISIEDLSDGVYYLQLKTKDANVVTKKIFILK